jgi:transglutaminase-like putative cysteine protease
VRIPYLAVPAKQPIPSLGGSLVRYRPIMSVRLTGPADTKLRDGLLDTGSDDTVFTEALAGLLGIDLLSAEERQVALAGRPQPVRCRYAPVLLRITDGISETYEWTAVVGFAASRLSYCLLGHAGFLQFFDANFQGDPDREVILMPKVSFPGRRVV